MKKNILIIISIMAALIWMLLPIFVFDRQFIFVNKDLIFFMSCWSAIGLFLLTTVYVTFVYKQLNEIKYQRLLQIQPFPSIDALYGFINSPNIFFNPHSGDVEIIVRIYIKYSIKNIGNGVSVANDVFGYFCGKKDKRDNDKYHINNYKIIELDNELKGYLQYDDDGASFIKTLPEPLNNELCSIGKSFDHLFSLNILYRNILYQPFSIKIDNIFSIDEENYKILSKWITIYDTFLNEYSKDINNIKAIYKTQKQQAWDHYLELKDLFYKKHPKEIVSFDLLPISESFEISVLDKKGYEKIKNKLFFQGIPLGKEHSEDLVAEIEKEKQIFLSD